MRPHSWHSCFHLLLPFRSLPLGITEHHVDKQRCRGGIKSEAAAAEMVVVVVVVVTGG